MPATVSPIRPKATSARSGNRNAAKKVADTSAPPWAKWRTRSLAGRAKRFMETYCVLYKGRGVGELMRLAPWQMDWIEASLVEGVDSSVLTLPRKNGKSTLVGGLALWALCDPVMADEFGGQPQIPVVGGVRIDQALKGIYGAAVQFAKHPEIASRTNVYNGSGQQRMVAPFNYDGELFPTAGSDFDALQGYDHSIAIVDEIGHVDDGAWNALLNGSGARDRQLTLGIGTRRKDNKPNALDFLVSQVELGVDMPGFVLLDYCAEEGADLDDRAQWRKANPGIRAGVLDIEALAKLRNKMPEDDFRTYRLNLKSGTQSGWLGVKGPVLWERLRDPFAMEPSAPTWVGVDSAKSKDCAAIVWCQQRPDGRTAVESQIWTPTPGHPIPWEAMEDLIRQLAVMYRVVGVHYDENYFARSAALLAAEGLPMIETPQSHERMAPLVAETYRRIITGNLTHNADGQFTAHVLNAQTRTFPESTGESLSRKLSTMKIDAAIAMCLAVGHSVITIPEPALTLEHLEF